MSQHEQKVIGNGYALSVDALLVWQNNIWFMLSLVPTIVNVWGYVLAQCRKLLWSNIRLDSSWA